MKIKMLRNFKSSKVILRQERVIEGELVKKIDELYGLKTLESKGIIEILDLTTEEVKPVEPTTVDETPHDFSDIVHDAPKKPKKKGK